MTRRAVQTRGKQCASRVLRSISITIFSSFRICAEGWLTASPAFSAPSPAMALAQLLAAAHCWTPPARPPTFTRRELGSLGAAGLAAASSGGILLPASAGGIPPQPYEKQPGFKLNTGQAFPTASFGLQVYDDATAQKLTSLALEVGHHNLPHLSAAPRLHPSAAPFGTQPFSYTPWPHPVATHPGHTPWPHLPSSLSHTPAPAGRLPQLLRLRARQEPGRLRTRHQGEWHRRPVTRVIQPPGRPPRKPVARACWPRSEAQAPPEPPRSARSVRATSRRRRLHLPPHRSPACPPLRCPRGPLHLQPCNVTWSPPPDSRRRARGPLHLRLGPLQPCEWQGGRARPLRAWLPGEHGSLVHHTGAPTPDQ